MKYFRTAEAAHALKVSKQTLLHWLYAGKVTEPPRDGNGYRLWSQARIDLVKALIADGRVNRRTIVHREPANRPDVIASLAAEVDQMLREGAIDAATFLRELARRNRAVAQTLAAGRPRNTPPGRKTVTPTRRRARA